LKRYGSNREQLKPTGTNWIGKRQFGICGHGPTGVTSRRQCAEKGKAYIAHLQWTNCQTVDKRIQWQIKEIVSSATTEENVDVVERNLSAFCVTVEELTRCVAVLLDDLEGEGDQLTVANDWYAEKSKQISDFIENIGTQGVQELFFCEL